ncbi:MAG: dual specificity protein phosphatase family protein [Calothrix sp. C42_A2020_038]|nr:dual specificity protein phosphatase family protein [Calothrix sp. C42_A2020_038]
MQQSTSQPIVENLWWVIPDKIAGVRKPTLVEISELKAVGISAFVSVLHDRSNLDLYEQLSIPYLWLPIDVGSSPSREQIEELQSFVDIQNSLGHAVAVHCTGGVHRTGTILAAYLIFHGLSYSDAMQKIQNINPSVHLEEAQSQFLLSLSGE